MPLKKRNKISADFSMASLTDVIFLLLIFFMLNANVTNAPAFELPTSDSRTVAPSSVVVTIRNTGETQVNQQVITTQQLEQSLLQAIAQIPIEDRPEIAVSIVAEVGTPFDYVADVMEIANALRLRAIIATQPRIDI